MGEPWRGLVSSYEVSSWLTRPLTCARYDSRFAPEPSWKLGERKHALICWTSNTDVRRERSTLPSKTEFSCLKVALATTSARRGGAWTAGDVSISPGGLVRFSW